MPADAINLRLGRHAVALAMQEWGPQALHPIGPHLSALRPLEPECDVHRRWHVVQTEPQQEKNVGERLREECKLDAFCPTEPRMVRVNPVKHRMTFRPMLPGYVFAGFDPWWDRWQVIPRLRGVLRLLMIEQRPVPIPDPIIDHIRNREIEMAGGRIAKGPPITIRVGALLRILDPFSFAGLFGHAVEIDQDEHRLCVEIDIFGRMVPLWLAPEQLEPV